MSDAYERERQNNTELDSLSGKVSALRDVTINIYNSAREQDVIENTNDIFANMSTQIKGSASRLTRMAQQGNKVAVLKLAGIIISVVLVLWWVMSWLFSPKKGQS